MADDIQTTDDQFYFDSYTAQDGSVFDITFPGNKIVPIRLKQSITLYERKMLSDRAIKAKLNMKSGKVSFEDLDQEAFQSAVLEIGVLEWPFKNRDGSAVPINKETLAKLPSSVTDQIVVIVMNISQQQLEANDPFVQPSEPAL